MTVQCYIIRGKKDFFYCGISKDVFERLVQHNRGDSISTRGHRPFGIVWYQSFKNYLEARKQEKKIKDEGVKRWLVKNLGTRSVQGDFKFTGVEFLYDRLGHNISHQHGG